MMPRMLKSILLFLIFSLMCTFWLWGHRASAAQVLSLGSILDLARERNLEIQSSREELLRARGKDLEGQAGYLPHLDITGSYTQQNNAMNGQGDKEYSGGGVTLSQTLYEGGKNKAKKNQALFFRDAANQGIELTTQDIFYRVLDTYYGVLLGKANVQTAEDALAYAREHLKETERKRILGIATNFEVIRAEQQESARNTELIAARNHLESAKIDLLTLLRLPQKGEYDFQGTLEYAPFRADPQKALEKALEVRPDLKKAMAEVAVQREQVIIERSGSLPRVSIYGKYAYDSPSGNYDDEEDTWSAGIQVSFPVFDGNEALGKALQEKATLHQQELGVRQREEEIKREIAQAHLDLLSTEEAVFSTKKNLELARESMRLAQVGYREGVGTQLDVLDAQTTLTLAQKEHSEAIKKHAMAMVALEKAQGILGNTVAATLPEGGIQ
ncbi:MAG TPA: TolC family protein [Synergistaceae bacterium]|nr:TolC family protein [Synergistaceae bacterium]